MNGQAPRLMSVGQTSLGQLALAKNLFQMGRQVEAIAEVDSILRDNPEQAMAHHLKGLILARRGDFAAAAENLENSARLDEKETGTWLALAHVRLELGLHDRALDAVRRCLAIDEKQAVAHTLRADILSASGNKQAAIESYLRASALDPQLAPTRLRLAGLLEQVGDVEGAMRSLEGYLGLNISGVSARITLGDLLRKSGRPEAAIREYKAASEILTWQALPHEKMGEAFLDSNLLLEAAIEFQIAVRLDAKRVNSFLNLSRIYRELGRLEEAAAMLQAAMLLDPRSVPPDEPTVASCQHPTTGQALAPSRSVEEPPNQMLGGSSPQRPISRMVVCCQMPANDLGGPPVTLDLGVPWAGPTDIVATTARPAPPPRELISGPRAVSRMVVCCQMPANDLGGPPVTLDLGVPWAGPTGIVATASCRGPRGNDDGLHDLPLTGRSDLSEDSKDPGRDGRPTPSMPTGSRPVSPGSAQM